MSSQPTIPLPQGHLSKKMCAVLRIITAEQTISDLAFRYMDLENDKIEWESIFTLDLGTGTKTALEFAYAVWTDQIWSGSSLFENAFSMNTELKKSCLQAIKIRWGV